MYTLLAVSLLWQIVFGVAGSPAQPIPAPPAGQPAVVTAVACQTLYQLGPFPVVHCVVQARLTSAHARVAVPMLPTAARHFRPGQRALYWRDWLGAHLR